MSVPSTPRPQSSLPVLRVAPRLATRPFLPLVHAPTPVEPLPGFGDRVWVKRDDLVSPLYGGNKVRRFEWLFAEAKARGADTIITVGGLASTQVTSTIVHGTAAGFRVKAVLFDQPDTPFVAEALALDRRAGGALVEGGGYVKTAALTLRELMRKERSYFIPPGASGPLANVSYVDAMLELAAQVERGEAPRPDRIVVACGSGGTTVGLAIGCAILGWPTIVVGVRITDLFASNPLTLRLLRDATWRLLHKEGLARKERRETRMRMEHRFIGGGYGHSTDAAVRGAARFTEVFCAAGEITYSGKALAALETIVREHPDERILFWNTLSTTGRIR